MQVAPAVKHAYNKRSFSAGRAQMTSYSLNLGLQPLRQLPENLLLFANVSGLHILKCAGSSEKKTSGESRQASFSGSQFEFGRHGNWPVSSLHIICTRSPIPKKSLALVLRPMQLAYQLLESPCVEPSRQPILPSACAEPAAAFPTLSCEVTYAEIKRVLVAGCDACPGVPRTAGRSGEFRRSSPRRADGEGLPG